MEKITYTKNWFFLFASFILFGCSPKVEPINFGNDECSFCRMSIVDQRYGAEILTSKGKVFKFDAIECMLRALCENTNNEAKFLQSALIIDFSNPGNLVDAKNSFYLHSQELPSPMGAYISGFGENLKATEAQQNFTGEIYNWNDVVLKVVGKKTCVHDF